MVGKWVWYFLGPTQFWDFGTNGPMDHGPYEPMGPIRPPWATFGPDGLGQWAPKAKVVAFVNKAVLDRDCKFGTTRTRVAP